MPVFLCSKCKVMENTALSNYWSRLMDVLQGQDPPPPLCSECDPGIRTWHGKFERQPIPDDHVVGPDGFVHHKDDRYLKSLLEEEQKKSKPPPPKPQDPLQRQQEELRRREHEKHLDTYRRQDPNRPS